MRLFLLGRSCIPLFLLVLLSLGTPGWGGEAVLNLSGQAVALNQQLKLGSAGRVPVSRVYDYQLQGTVRGTGDLASLVPPGTSLQSLSAILGGPSIPLSGRIVNPSGRLPFTIINQSGTRIIPFNLPIVGPVQVQAGVNLRAGIQGNGTVFFSFLATARPMLGSIPVIGIGGLGGVKGTVVFEAGSRLTVRTFFEPFAGQFVGPIESDPFVSGRQGMAKVNVTLGGIVTGSLRVLGKNFPIRTGLNENFSTPVVRLGNTGLTVQFTTSSENPNAITVDVWQNGAAFTDGVMERTIAANDPLLRKGAYTITLVPPPLAGEDTAATKPVGHGYLLGTVTATGSVTLAGQLCDGKRITCATALLPTLEIPFYAPLLGGQGSVSGTLKLRGELSANDIDGNLRWLKPATLTERVLKSQLDVDLTARGSRYVRPARGQGVLLLTTGSFLLSGGNLAAALSVPFTFMPPNVFATSITSGLKVQAALGNGLLKGSFKAPDKPGTPVRGVVLQKQNTSSGFFIGKPDSGALAESGLLEIAP